MASVRLRADDYTILNPVVREFAISVMIVATDYLLCGIIGTLWGCPNTFIRLGALQVQRKRQKLSTKNVQSLFGDLPLLLTTPSFIIPQSLNLCGSAAFSWLQGRVRLTVAGPVVNTVALAANAVADWAAGEPVHLHFVIPGVALIALGAALCST